MSAKNAIYTGQKQSDSTAFEGLQTDAGIFNTSRSVHGSGHQQIHDIQHVHEQAEHGHICDADIGGRRTISTDACEFDLSCDLKSDQQPDSANGR